MLLEEKNGYLQEHSRAGVTRAKREIENNRYKLKIDKWVEVSVALL